MRSMSHRKHLGPVVVRKVGVFLFQEVVVEHHRPLHLVERFDPIGFSRCIKSSVKRRRETKVGPATAVAVIVDER